MKKIKRAQTAVLCGSCCIVPVYSFAIGLFPREDDYRYKVLFCVLAYSALVVFVLFNYFWKQRAVRIKREDIKYFIISFLCLWLASPINSGTILTVIATLCSFLIASRLMKAYDYFWLSANWKKLVPASIGYGIGVILLVLISKGTGEVNFSWIYILQALAAGISEEVIFRVALVILLRESIFSKEIEGSEVRIFLCVNIPFVMMHYISYDFFQHFAMNIFGMLLLLGISYGLTYTIKKYGVVFGMYLHFLMDFLIFMIGK